MHVRGRIESNYNEVIRDAVLAGLGIALHSMWHIADDLAAGRMQRVLPDYEVPGSEIYSIKPQRCQVPPRVRAFEDFLIEHFGHQPPWDRIAGV